MRIYSLVWKEEGIGTTKVGVDLFAKRAERDKWARTRLAECRDKYKGYYEEARESMPLKDIVTLLAYDGFFGSVDYSGSEVSVSFCVYSDAHMIPDDQS